MNRFTLIFILFWVSSNFDLQGQTGPLPTIDAISDSLRAQFLKVQDYQVDMTVRLKMPGLRMPRKKITLYFKQPDKYQIESKGFAMVPRRGLMTVPDSILASIGNASIHRGDADQAHQIILAGEMSTHFDQVMQIEAAIDTAKWIIRSLKTMLDTLEVFRLDTDFSEPIPGIFLPEVTRLQFRLDEQFLSDNRGPHMPRSPRRSLKVLTMLSENDLPEWGTAVIEFSDYQLNRGLPDSLFTEPADTLESESRNGE